MTTPTSLVRALVAHTAERRKIAAFVAAATTVTAFLVTTAQPASARAALLAAGPVAPNASAVGKLTPRGCAADGSGGTRCDLYAKRGTTQLTGGPNVDIWGFATDSTSAVTAPGPLLVVNQGDSVTITVHNELQIAGMNVALALPGQQSVNGGGGDDVTGAAPGGTMDYTFTASRPGTFVYEAGHTADGARQVAMGLAGALVVLPSTPGTLDGNPAGYPDTSYDDDVPLVLSEVDPAFNADPLNFDVRDYRPIYRLINGHSYPSAANLFATDQAHKVLVRYVNVGQQLHAMSVLGGSQLEIAQDGHPLKYSTTVTAEDVQAGMTLDTIVTMPGTAGVAPDPKTATKVEIYEAGGALDNDSQLANSSSTQVAFGGMLAVLDTQAPVDTSQDYVGPTAKSLSVSPNPSDATKPVTVTATISDAATGGGAVQAAEYVLDADQTSVGVGGGVPMSIGASAVTTTATGTIPTSVLADPAFTAGRHTVYVRGEDASGNWGVYGSVVLNVPKTGPATTAGTATPALTNGTAPIAISATGDDSAAGGTITQAEYFLDNSPAETVRGTAMTINRNASVVSVDATIPVNAPAGPQVGNLAEGSHLVWVRVKDSFGLWGPLLDIPITIDKTAPSVAGAAVSPPATNGKQSDPSNPGYFRISAEITDTASNVVQGEAFLKTAGGNGTGIQMRPVDGKMDSADESMYALVPLSQLTGYKTDQKIPVLVHGKDAAGNWNTTFDTSASLILDRTAPVLGATLSATLGDPGQAAVALRTSLTEANTVRAAEVWTGTTDPGVGKATPASFSVGTGTVTVFATFPSTTAATVFHVRVMDMAGNWSNASATGSVRGFRNLMEAGSTGWPAADNAARISSLGAAAQPTPDEPASANGMQVNVALTSTQTRTADVRDTNPVTSRGYHARFQFAANTLNSGTNANNVVTVFDAASADRGTGEVFALQFRGSGATAQIRAAIGGTVGVWKTVGSGSHTIQLDWTGGANAALVLTVDGTAQYTVSATNVTATIESAQLGVISNSVTSTTTVGTTGAAWFDTFLSISS